MQKKKSQIIFRFWDNCYWKCSYKLSLIRGEYLQSALNGLTNSPKILHYTQRTFWSLNFIRRDQSIWETFCRSPLKISSAPLPCYLVKGPLERDTLDIELTTDFGVRKFKNPSAMKVIFFRKMFKIKSKFRKSEKKIENIFFVSEIKTSEKDASVKKRILVISSQCVNKQSYKFAYH